MVKMTQQWVAQNRARSLMVIMTPRCSTEPGVGAESAGQSDSPMGSTEPGGRSLLVKVARHWVAHNQGRSLPPIVAHQWIAPNRERSLLNPVVSVARMNLIIRGTGDAVE